MDWSSDKTTAAELEARSGRLVTFGFMQTNWERLVTGDQILQLTELEKEFEKLGCEKPQQIRYLRSQQGLKLKREALEYGGEEDGDDGGVEEPEEAAIDPVDLLDPVDILSKLPKDFYEKCEAKKWQERKEAIEVLQQLTLNPKLESGDYGELVKVLKKVCFHRLIVELSLEVTFSLNYYKTLRKDQ